MSIGMRVVSAAWAAGAVLVALSADLTVASADDKSKAHWSYEGSTGPDHWGDLSPDFAACRSGRQQTPIDLAQALPGGGEGIVFDYRPLDMSISNNGHTIEVATAPGAAVLLYGERYELAQFHFHHPSEHVLDGVPFDMEIHFVHKSAAGRLAVVGIFVKSGAHNPRLEPILSRMPDGTDVKVAVPGRMNPAAIFPSPTKFFHYMGSLTTPPCSEGLAWTVYKDAIEASPEQIGRFATLFPNNARPLQGRNDRLLVETSSR